MLLFLFQRVRADLVALVVLVMLGLTGLVQPEDVFNGFSSNAVISVIATMILGMRAMNAASGCSRALMPSVPTAADRNGMNTAKNTSLATMSLAS